MVYFADFSAVYALYEKGRCGALTGLVLSDVVRLSLSRHMLAAQHQSW